MSTPGGAQPGSRLASIDACRGWVMLLMMAEVLKFCAVSQAFPESGFWRFLCWQQSHVEWAGCSLHDLIQPGFSFLVGVVAPFSIASRQARGQTYGSMVRHASLRSAMLVGLGIVMIWVYSRSFVVEFTDTLAQIGLAYPAVFLLAFYRPRVRWSALGLVLVGYWLFFAFYPLPGSGFDYARVGVSKEWLATHGLGGFAAHWQRGSNPAAAFDVWFLNRFPRKAPHLIAYHGLATLNFIPLVGTMILGLFAGDVLRSERHPREKVRWLMLAGLAGIAGGWLVGVLGVCPVIKSIWTPSWVLFSGGWCFLFMAAAYAVVDIGGHQKWVAPLIVVGMNSIVAYCLTHVFQHFASNSLRRVFGWETFRCFGEALEPLFYGAAVLAFLWGVLFVMYRLKIFIRI